MKARYWRMIPFIVFALLAVFFWRGLSLDPKSLPSAQLGKPLPQFKLPILGDARQVLTPASFLGQVALLNVWASWCEACIEEQQFLLQLAHEGVVIFGMNYKDNREDARQWLAKWGNPYRLIGEDTLGKGSLDMGVYGAPETFLVDKMGIIRYRHVGVLNERIWQDEFLPLISQLKGVV